MPENTKPEDVIKTIPAEDVEVLPDRSIDRTQKDIPIETLIALKNKGLTLEQIAKIVKCSKQNIQQRLDAIGYNKQDLENFKETRADVFAFLQSKLINSIEHTKIKKLNPYQRIVGASILYDKERLELGKSTGRIDIHCVINQIESLTRQEQVLEARYRHLTSKELKTDNDK